MIPWKSHPWASVLSAIVLAGLTPARTSIAWEPGAPVVYWDGDYWDGGGNLTDSLAQQAVAGGYNLVLCWTLDQVAIADQYGLRSQLVIDITNANVGTEWLDDPAKKAILDAKIDAFRTHPSAYSYYVRDEPSASQFPDLSRIVSYAAPQTFTVTGPGNLSVFDAPTGLWTATGQNHVTRTLPPGGGMLVRLTSLIPEQSNKQEK